MLSSLNWILAKETNSSNGRYWMLLWYLRFDFSWFCISEISEKDSIFCIFFLKREECRQNKWTVFLLTAWHPCFSLLSLLAFVGLPHNVSSPTAACVLRSLSACVWCSYTLFYLVTWGFPPGSVVKNLPANSGGADSKPRLGRSPGEANGNLLQYSYLKSPMGRGFHWVAKSRTQLSSHAKHYSYSWINLRVPP